MVDLDITVAYVVFVQLIKCISWHVDVVSVLHKSHKLDTKLLSVSGSAALH